MFFKCSNDFEGNLRRLLGERFTTEELDKGIIAFENLINITNEASNFNQEYGQQLNGSSIINPDWDFYTGCRLEGFFRKIEMLKGNNVEDVMLNGYYTGLGFYKWLYDKSVINARRNDPANAKNADNLRGGDGFHLNEADASKYIGCPHYFYDYIVAYQLRNTTKGHDNPADKDPIIRMNMIKSLFTVYIHQCIINHDIITKGYRKELVEKKVDYVKYVNNLHIDYDKFEKLFLQLEWYDDTNNLYEFSLNKSMKFIGEAGMGKTTQMRKIYISCIKEILNRNIKVLPIWIELSELEEASLEDKVKEALGEYSQYYSILMECNTIALFLDGYNEIVGKESQDIIRKKFASDIDDIHKKYPELFIAITDRNKRSNPPCLQTKISVYSFKGMSKEEQLRYVKVKAMPEKQASIEEFLHSDKSDWMNHTFIIPAKMNNLMELVSEGTFPETEDDFYNSYLNFILEREENKNKETRIDDLNYLLYILANDLQSPEDEKTQNEITKLWMPVVGDLGEVRRLFNLAIELPILGHGSTDRTYKFAYDQYFYNYQD